MGQCVVLQVAARQGDFTVDAGHVTAGRPQGTVGFIASPADRTFVQPAFEAAHAVRAFTILVDKVGITFRRAFVGIHGQVFRRQTQIDAVVFGNGDAHAHARACGGGFILFRAGRGFTRVVRLAVNIVTEAHAVGCEIRIGKRQRAVQRGFTA